MPVMTALAYKIQALYGELVVARENTEESKFFEDNPQSHDMKTKEFTLGEVMKITVNMDFADEIGRRKTFALVRECAFCRPLELALTNTIIQAIWSPKTRFQKAWFRYASIFSGSYPRENAILSASSSRLYTNFVM